MSVYVVSLPHPRYEGKYGRYLFVDDARFLELQSIENPDQDTMPNSWFIGNSVEEQGVLYFASPIDVLFLALPWFLKARKKTDEHDGYFTSLDQILSSSSTGEKSTDLLLSALNSNPKRINAICDVREPYTPTDDARYRLNDAKLAAWLDSKVVKLCRQIAQQPGLAPHEVTAEITSSSTTSSSSSSSSSSLTSFSSSSSSHKSYRTNPVVLSNALAFMSEYLPSAVYLSLLEANEVTAAAVTATACGGGGGGHNKNAGFGMNMKITADKDISVGRGNSMSGGVGSSSSSSSSGENKSNSFTGQSKTKSPFNSVFNASSASSSSSSFSSSSSSPASTTLSSAPGLTMEDTIGGGSTTTSLSSPTATTPVAAVGAANNHTKEAASSPKEADKQPQVPEKRKAAPSQPTWQKIAAASKNPKTQGSIFAYVVKKNE